MLADFHPEWPFEHYLELLSAIKGKFPHLAIKAFTAVEIDYMSRMSGLTLDAIFKALKQSGLELMPGGGAVQIFAEQTRNKLCPEKISGDRWLEIMETAHKAGIKTNATMLYGRLESLGDRVDHLLKLRALQDGAGGFRHSSLLPIIP